MHSCRFVYLPSNGALFVGYVMVLAFISSPLELIRVPELMIYVYKRLTAVTRLEREKALSKVRSRSTLSHIHISNVQSYSGTSLLWIPLGPREVS